MEELSQSLAVKVAYVRIWTPQPPETIKLYEPPNSNRECLHCRAGARSFVEGAVHIADPDLRPAIKAK